MNTLFNDRYEVESGALVRRSSWVWGIVLFLVARLFLSAFGVFVLQDANPAPPVWDGSPTVYRFQELVAPTGGEAWEVLVNAWYRWDTGWYLKIAAYGYSMDDGSIVFPPLYPSLIRIIQPWLGNYLVAALLISNLFGLLTLVLFFELAWQVLGTQRLALWAVIFLIAFPTGFYLLAAYSESLFLVLVLFAWLLVRRQHWLWAGVVSGVAVLARLQGWMLVAPFLWLFAIQGMGISSPRPREEFTQLLSALRQPEGRTKFYSLLCGGKWLPLFIPLVVFWGYDFWLRSAGLGNIIDAFAQYWNSYITPPWQVLWVNLNALLASPDFSGILNVIFLVFLGLILIFIFLHLEFGFTLYSLGMVGLTISRISTYPFISIPRYFLTIFPAFLALALLGRRRWVNIGFLCLFLAGQIFLVWMYLNWFWVA